MVASGSSCMSSLKTAGRSWRRNDLADASDDPAQGPNLPLLFWMRRTAQRLSKNGTGREDEGGKLSTLAALLGTTHTRQRCVQPYPRCALVFWLSVSSFMGSRAAMGGGDRNRRKPRRHTADPNPQGRRQTGDRQCSDGEGRNA